MIRGRAGAPRRLPRSCSPPRRRSWRQAPPSPSSTKLGRIDFPTSGTPDAQAQFLTGALLLHSFEFEDAATAFRKARGDRARLRHGVLGRGDDVQPPALGGAGPRRRAEGAREARRDTRGAAREGADGAREDVSRRRRGPVRRRRQAGAGPRVCRSHAAAARAIPGRPRRRELLRALDPRRQRGQARHRRVHEGRGDRRGGLREEPASTPAPPTT